MDLRLKRIFLAAFMFAAAMGVEYIDKLPTWQLLVAYLVPYLIAGYDVIGEAIEALTHGKGLDEHFLMTVATIGALVIGFVPGADNEFAEAVFVMLFFQVGELFEDYAEEKSRRSIAHLMSIRPDRACVLRGGRQVEVEPSAVSVGETLVVRPGERVALDGTISAGASSIDTSALTGESMPLDVCAGDVIASGCVNLTGVLRVEVTKPYGASTVARIIDLVEKASEKKSHREAFITRFARVYTPVVVGLAVFIALAMPLMCHFVPGIDRLTGSSSLTDWISRALTFLVVSCPCALVISVPLTFFCGIGGASRRGILVKGSRYMETLARVGTVVFDKTGTLTKGEFAVAAVRAVNIDERKLLSLAAGAERHSPHPIAAALLKACDARGITPADAVQVTELAGRGVKAVVDGDVVCVGNARLMEDEGAWTAGCRLSTADGDCAGTTVYMAVGGVYMGSITVTDTLRDDAVEAVGCLKRMGISKTVMLTGDCKEAAAVAAEVVGVDEYQAGMLPSGKVFAFERLTGSDDEPTDSGHLPSVVGNKRCGTVAFIGDGINDAPVLARADVGIAMGALCSDAAIEAADVVIMDDKLLKVSLAVRIARRTLGIATQNIVFAIGIKVAVLVLAFFGIATMWMAVFADVGVTVLAVLNAMRALRIRE